MSDRILLGTRKGVFTVERQAGGRWGIASCKFFADNCPMLVHDQRDGAIYAALDHGHFGNKLHRSEDGGETWTELAVPAYPEKPADEMDLVHEFSGKVIDWKLKLIWELQPGGPDQPGRLWCGTLPGGLFRSDDRGESWSLVDDLWYRPERREWFGGGFDEAGLHSVCIDPRDSRHILIGLSCGGVWRSEDDGSTWTPSARGMRAEYMPPERQFDQNIQDPHILRRCPGEPDKLWVQHHNGIFRSVDNGRNWTEIDPAPRPSGFGFACAVHPSRGDCAWFVPAQKDEKRVPVDARVVVTRTEDGGKSFDILTDGLPQEHAYDIVFRHALDVDRSGERLAFGTTTGSLFISENGGESWQHLSAHLPPIYCTRFAGV